MNNKSQVAALVLFICIAPMMTESQTLLTRPGKPRLNEQVTFEFTPSPASPALDSLNLILRTVLTEFPDTIAMVHEGNHWKVTTTLRDSSVSILLFHLQGQDNQGQAFIMNDQGRPFKTLIYSASGTPVRGAYMSEALYFSGYGNLQSANLEKAIKAIDQELKQYPANYSARLLKYTLLIQKQGITNEAAYLIKEDIQKTLRRENESIEALQFALQGYQMIEDEQEIRKIQEKLIQKNPDGQHAAARAFNVIMSLDNAKEQAMELETFIQEYPTSHLMEIALSQLASTVIELDDSTAMINVGDRLLLQAQAMSGASGLSALAGVLAEKKWQLDQAQRYIRRAIQIIDQVDPVEHPPEISNEEWEERIQYTRARYQDIAGWILFQKEEYMKALSLLEEASVESMEPGIFYHLAETLNAVGNEDQAISTYAKVAAYGGVMAEMARNRLFEIWQTTDRDSTQLQELLNLHENQVENDHVRKILQRRQIKKAPDFSLNRLGGSHIQLSDMRGQKVLLCFWATWSDASLQMTEVLQDIAAYRDDLTILAVAVDRDASEISRFIRDNRIPFQVLLIDRKVEIDYQLKGVPVLYVIDSVGRIQFYHKGFRPDLIEILNIELDNLE